MAAFPTTRWTLIRQAVAEPTNESKQALESLCQQYAAPVLAFVRHRVASIEKAEDIAQGFFAHVLESEMLDRADEERGRFRTFLLHSLRGFMADVHDFDTAQKRGGGKQIVSFATAGVAEPANAATPELQFELQWVRTLLSSSLQQLETEYATTDKAELFGSLRGFLDSGEKKPVNDLATELRMSEPAIRVATHRMRKRLGQIIRAEIAETVPRASDVDDELSRLMQILETRT